MAFGFMTRTQTEPVEYLHANHCYCEHYKPIFLVSQKFKIQLAQVASARHIDSHTCI